MCLSIWKEEKRIDICRFVICAFVRDEDGNFDDSTVVFLNRDSENSERFFFSESQSEIFNSKEEAEKILIKAKDWFTVKVSVCNPEILKSFRPLVSIAQKLADAQVRYLQAKIEP